MARGPKCYNCGEFGHISRDCPSTALGPKCYNCGQYGHLAHLCQSADPALSNPVMIENVALPCGLQPRAQHNAEAFVLFYVNDDGVKFGASASPQSAAHFQP